MQKISIMGRLVKDAVVRESDSRKFGAFKMAVNSKVRGVEKASYYDILWRNYNEKMMQYLTKGSALIVVGDLNASTEVSAKDGKTYLRLEVFADSVEFPGLGSSANTATSTVTEGTTAPVAQPTARPVAQPSVYAQPAAPAPQPSVYAQPAAPVAQPAYAGATTADDDLPF